MSLDAHPRYDVHTEDTTGGAAEDVEITRGDAFRFIFPLNVPSETFIRLGSNQADRIRVAEGREIDCGVDIRKVFVTYAAGTADLELQFSPCDGVRQASDA